MNIVPAIMVMITGIESRVASILFRHVVYLLKAVRRSSLFVSNKALNEALKYLVNKSCNDMCISLRQESEFWSG